MFITDFCKTQVAATIHDPALVAFFMHFEAEEFNWSVFDFRPRLKICKLQFRQVAVLVYIWKMACCQVGEIVAALL